MKFFFLLLDSLHFVLLVIFSSLVGTGWQVYFFKFSTSLLQFFYFCHSYWWGAGKRQARMKQKKALWANRGIYKRSRGGRWEREIRWALVQLSLHDFLCWTLPLLSFAVAAFVSCKGGPGTWTSKVQKSKMQSESEAPYRQFSNLICNNNIIL